MDNAVLPRRGTGYGEVYEYEFSELESACCLMDAEQLPCPCGNVVYASAAVSFRTERTLTERLSFDRRNDHVRTILYCGG